VTGAGAAGAASAHTCFQLPSTVRIRPSIPRGRNRPFRGWPAPKRSLVARALKRQLPGGHEAAPRQSLMGIAGRRFGPGQTENAALMRRACSGVKHWNPPNGPRSSQPSARPPLAARTRRAFIGNGRATWPPALHALAGLSRALVARQLRATATRASRKKQKGGRRATLAMGDGSVLAVLAMLAGRLR
jgi:hypothetical protein